MQAAMAADPYPIFVLTLKGDEARRAPLVAWLDRHGLEYELFFGVDGRGGLAPEWEAQIDRAKATARLGRKMGDGEFACALSHQEIYREILERGLPGAVVLEDDAVPGDAFAAFMASRGYARAGMILLDHSNTRVARVGAVDLGNGALGRPVTMSPFLTTGYTVSAEAATELRRLSLPISFTADWPCDLSRVGAVAAWPRLIGHPVPDPAQSHIAVDRGRQRRWGRFVQPGYWRRWWRKRRSELLPETGP